MRISDLSSDVGSSDLSQGLWHAAPETFLANGRAEGDHPDIQQILLSQDCTAANGARHIALADGVWRDEALEFDRAFYFFDDDSIEGTRASRRVMSKKEGVETRFWPKKERKWVKGTSRRIGHCVEPCEETKT